MNVPIYVWQTILVPRFYTQISIVIFKLKIANVLLLKNMDVMKALVPMDLIIEVVKPKPDQAKLAKLGIKIILQK